MLIDLDFYLNHYHGEAVEEAAFHRYYARAESVISSITHGRVTEETFAIQPIWVQTAYKNALCAQVEYLTYNGFDVASGTDEGGFTVGKVSISGGGSGLARGQRMISPNAVMILEPTGLMFAGVGVFS